MRIFGRFAILATAATYLLIFVGGLVRVSGAGLGCPDWPKCFGRWIPPMSVRQLPADIDPSRFNFVLAWIEYINRLIGVAIGLLIVIVAILAIIYHRKRLKILIPSILAAVLVAFQGWQGSRVVASELEPLIVSVHMGIAFIIASLLVYLSTQAYLFENPETEKDTFYPKNMTPMVGFLWILMILQVILGTQVREAIENLIRIYPLLPETQLLNRLGSVSYLHTILGIVVAFGAWFVAFWTFSGNTKPSSLVWQASWSLAGLAFLQIVFGIILFTIGMPEVMQALHMWVASLLTGITLLFWTALRYKKEVAS